MRYLRLWTWLCHFAAMWSRRSSQGLSESPFPQLRDTYKNTGLAKFRGRLWRANGMMLWNALETVKHHSDERNCFVVMDLFQNGSGAPGSSRPCSLCAFLGLFDLEGLVESSGLMTASCELRSLRCQSTGWGVGEKWPFSF